jgi:hypothetical protein
MALSLPDVPAPIPMATLCHTFVLLSLAQSPLSHGCKDALVVLKASAAHGLPWGGSADEHD